MLKSIMSTVGMVVLILALSGCVPVLVGGMFYKSTKNKSEKNSFLTEFRKQNLEREKAGLKPMDWCSEVYKFDKGWATENADCAKRVRRYEAGDKTAINP